MEKFLKRLGVFLAIQLLIAAVLVSNAFRQPRYGYVAAFEDKAKLLRDHDEPHLILIGGSNVAFGFDSSELQNQLGMPVINVGLHAATGLQFYLDVAAKHAKPGDTIVLSPEWNLLNLQLHPEAKFIQELVRQSPSSWTFLFFNSEFDWKEFLDDQALPELAHLVQQGFRHHDSNGQQQAIREANMTLYNRLNFNENGDFVGHHKLGFPQIKYIATADIRFNAVNYLAVSRQINQCAKACRRKGATLFLAYAPIPVPVYERSVQALDAGHHFLKSNLDVPVLHPPTSVKYPVSCFFDTINHLNLEGKSIRTRLIASTLREYDSQVATNPTGLVR